MAKAEAKKATPKKVREGNVSARLGPLLAAPCAAPDHGC
jgi:hypothetical protein